MNTMTADPNYVMPIEEKLKVAADTLDAYREMLEIAQNNASHYKAALQSIADNTCCDKCQEARLVALKALSPPTSEGV